MGMGDPTARTERSQRDPEMRCTAAPGDVIVVAIMKL
jgi:hypothetical protein